jgi:hypothetical protein
MCYYRMNDGTNCILEDGHDTPVHVDNRTAPRFVSDRHMQALILVNIMTDFLKDGGVLDIFNRFAVAGMSRTMSAEQIQQLIKNVTDDVKDHIHTSKTKH